VALVLIGILGLETAEGRGRFGIQSGLTDDPDAWFFGGHLFVTGPFGTEPRLAFEPSAEIGFDDDYTTLRFNGRFKYLFPVDRVDVYPLGGLAIYHLSLDNCEGNCSDTELGLDVGGGVRGRRLSFDLALGLGDIPDVTLTVGYTFGR
jgi:hypothetical protein